MRREMRPAPKKLLGEEYSPVLRAVLLLIAFAFVGPRGRAQNSFVFTNNDPIPAQGQNTVSGFSVGDKGIPVEVPGSPFRTGGFGGGGGFIASNRIATVGNFVYASNTVSNTVSGFSIDPETGSLTPVPGSPFATGGMAGSGFSLAATPDRRFLHVASDFSADIRTFSIDAKDGRLTLVGEPVPLGDERSANSMKVSPDGKWLVVVLTRLGPHGAVAMFSIDSKTGELTPPPGSPFWVRGPGGPEGIATGVDINCASDTLFVAEATAGTTVVDVLRIDPESGALTAIEGSPFSPGVGVNSNVALLSAGDSVLFVSNQRSNSITVFAVASDGGLTLVPGSPFSAGDGRGPSQMATDPTGGFLYVAKGSEPFGVVVLTVGSSGEVTEIPGAFAPTDQPGLLLSLAAYPGKTCPKKEKEG